MLWQYTYFDHEICKLHEQVADFLSRSNDEATPPRPFNLTYHCNAGLGTRCQSSAKLGNKLRSFYNAFVKLAPDEKVTAIAAFRAVNAIDLQLENRRRRYVLLDLPKTLRDPAKKLFVFLYTDTLGAGGKVKDHWIKFYAGLQSKDCPFCAIEPLHHPDFYKQDYDHLLCKDIYPFAAVNMRNLVPMGRDCNTIFKKTKDVVFKNGARRRAFKPFEPSGVQIRIDLSGSVLPTAGNRKGKWRLTVTPSSQEVTTWLDVFSIPARYQKEVLEPRASSWIGDFRNLAKASAPAGGWTVPSLRTMLGKYAKSFCAGGYSEFRLLKAPFFDLLHKLDPQKFLVPLVNSIN